MPALPFICSITLIIMIQVKLSKLTPAYLLVLIAIFRTETKIAQIFGFRP
jgi:hypothetical protein